MKSNALKVNSEMTGFRNDKPLQQYFKPFIIDHLSFIHNENQLSTKFFKKLKSTVTGVKR